MKLKPCPFCGEYPNVNIGTSLTDKEEEYFYVECMNRDCLVQPRIVCYSESNTEEAWNTRAEEPAEDKTAHWDINCDGYYPYCSNCKEEPQGGKLSPYCPNCGAEMVTRGDDT